MTRVMAVRFAPEGRLYRLDAAGVEAQAGRSVLVPTDSGNEVATVVWISEADLDKDLPHCAGLATQADIERDQNNRKLKAEATQVAKALIAEHGLAMRVVGVDLEDRSSEYGQLVAVYYMAPGRVDFRGLVRDLASALTSRVDLRQIGVRDAARILGGVGVCGRDLCCSTVLPELEPIGMRLVKGQHLAVRQPQTQGACGRLTCCLGFEQATYDDFERRAPAIGSLVETANGTGIVVDRSVPLDSVTLRCSGGQRRVCPLAEITKPSGSDMGTAEVSLGHRDSD